MANGFSQVGTGVVVEVVVVGGREEKVNFVHNFLMIDLQLAVLDLYTLVLCQIFSCLLLPTWLTILCTYGFK